MIVHLLVGSMSACRRGEFGSTDRAAVTCRRCHALMDAGAERPLQPYLPSGRKPLKRKKAEPEPKDTMIVAGMKVVLDAPQVKLRKGDYP